MLLAGGCLLLWPHPGPERSGAVPVAAAAHRGEPTASLAPSLASDDPQEAFRALTAARAAALERGDTEALRALTAAGSPARRAESEDSAQSFRGRDVSLEVERVETVRADAQTATVRARVRTSVSGSAGRLDYGQAEMLAELRRERGRWVVHSVTRLRSADG